MTPDEMSADEREEYEERAAIAEYCGGLSRANAEALALERIRARRLARGLNKKQLQKKRY
jgi:ribosomal protein S6